MKFLKLIALGGFVLSAGLISNTVFAAGIADSAVCKQLRASNPELQGKTLVNAINPHTPGYEALDPNDPSHYVGFDIDLGEQMGECLGFKVEYKSVGFAALLPTLQSGQANFVISDIYATSERAKAADFITYSKVFDGVLVAKGNPKKITGINLSLCGATAAENTGFVEVPLIQALEKTCKAAGKPAPDIQLYDNNASCIQAVLNGRADTYINDINTVEQAVKANPTALAKAVAVTLPYSVGIAVPKGNEKFRTAMFDALVEIQNQGIETQLLKKWSLGESNLEKPKLVLN
ncbi:ABC transporter substrate-binding protein [Martelella alba]|uniref:ABC transporter substrate-binding protein n=1 Tax=Martelella alba TaxID=2590451 RepID=A0ABY2SQW9_9HYPH|nr:ABC transporter substrate-binding protein [Martelella alba]TKI07750.1 ABC transporter substrate-binding protein [Martelella alba]